MTTQSCQEKKPFLERLYGTDIRISWSRYLESPTWSGILSQKDWSFCQRQNSEPNNCGNQCFENVLILNSKLWTLKSWKTAFWALGKGVHLVEAHLERSLCELRLASVLRAEWICVRRSFRYFHFESFIALFMFFIQILLQWFISQFSNNFKSIGIG